MKKFLLYVIAATLFAACSVDSFEDVPIQTTDTPERLFVSFDEEDARIQLGEAGQPVWTKGDKVSVFYHSNINQKWSFEGETGVTSGTLVKTNEQVAPPHNVVVPTTRIVAAYPYFTGYWYDYDTHEIWVSLPASQKYLKDSFGVSTSIMVASSKRNNGLSFKNVCGWLKLQLTGSHTVTKIELKGNNNEQVAGTIYINTLDATCELASQSDIIYDPTQNDNEVSANATRVDASLDATITKTIVLDCSKEANGGVALDSKTPTAFYIALPPQTFNNGISITVTCADGLIMNKSTSNKITIQRNHILPMASIEVKKETPEASKIEANFAANSNIKWNYAEDAQQDAYKYDSDDSTLAVYSRQNVALGVSEEMLSQLQALGIDQLLADATPTFYTVEGENEVQNTSIEASVTTNENGDYLLNIANFEWGKTYKVQYTFQEEGVYEVILNATVTTDAERSNDIVKLSSETTVKYQDQLAFAAFAEGMAPVVSLTDIQIPYTTGFDDTASFLAEVLSNTAGKEYTIVDTIKSYNASGELETLSENIEDLWSMNDEYRVSVCYSYEMFQLPPSKVVYTREVALWYGQTIQIVMTVIIKAPEFEVLHDADYFTTENGKLVSTIEPEYEMEGNAIKAINSQLDLNQAFYVVDKNTPGKVLTYEEIEAAGLKLEFLLDDEYEGVSINDNNILEYYGHVSQVGLVANLYISNSNTPFSSIDTIVRTKNLSVVSKPSDQNNKDLYSSSLSYGDKKQIKVNLLQHIPQINLKRYSNTLPIVDEQTCKFITGNGQNGFVEGLSPIDAFKLKFNIKLKAISVTPSSSPYAGSYAEFFSIVVENNELLLVFDTAGMKDGFVDNNVRFILQVDIVSPWGSNYTNLNCVFTR